MGVSILKKNFVCGNLITSCPLTPIFIDSFQFEQGT